jgi:hypothetical protein
VRAIPDDIHRFLHANIDSVEQLEVLLLLQRERDGGERDGGERDGDWTAESAARVLYSQPSSIAGRLASLQAKGLVANSGAGYRYAPKSDAVRDTVSRLAETYRERRVAVITVIASKPMENVRAFSDAFRLRQRDEED